MKKKITQCSLPTKCFPSETEAQKKSGAKK
jgi:hypothetical protein